MAEKYRWIRVGWVIDYVTRALSDGTDLPSSHDMTIHIYLDFSLLKTTPYVNPEDFKTWVADAKKSLKIDGKLVLAPMGQVDRNRWMVASPMGMEFNPPSSVTTGAGPNRFKARIQADELYTDESLADIAREWSNKKTLSNRDAAQKLINKLNTTAGCEVASFGDGSLEKVINAASRDDYYGECTC